MTDVIAFGPNDVHVWCGTIPHDQAIGTSTWNVLSSDERAAADRLRNEDDRRVHVHARATLRRLLARYAGTGPEDLDFEQNKNGKPALVAGPGRPALRFNVSHSATKVLIAVTADREVGVDVERIQPDFPWQAVACALFSPDEIAAIRGAPGSRRVQTFFDCWVRKEAYLKGRGRGLSASLRDFVVPLDPNGGAVHDDLRACAVAAGWRVHPLDVGPGYAAALAVAGAARVSSRPLTDAFL